MIGDSTRCPKGCHECCLGPFEIDREDATRLREGLTQLAQTDPARAARLQARARASAGGDDDPCPALDPATGRCDLYEHRPKTCRVFGTAVLHPSGAITACEIIYPETPDQTIAAEADPLPPDLEPASGPQTTVAVALSSA
jgi:Fe-S-cluster containining protein